jgi:NADH-quinone oxidoreductase subunit M
VFVLASFASMGLPGFSGFVAELQVLIGAWRAFPWFAVVSGIGILIGVAYTLRALQKAFYGKAGQGGEGMASGAETLPPISLPEKIGAALLLASTIVVGLYPQLLLRWIEPAVGDLLAGLGRGRP